ncbi:uncharacterized protein [Nicotiana sylvestris]|uniref:uncharacterized protein n=1 Tax=Nicotiana sylvestris TaxID=4096 RepID=UPI00388CDD00
MDFGGSWDQLLSLVEFAYNNKYQSSIQMALCKALYGRRCCSPVGWFEPGEANLLGTDLVRDAMEKVKLIQDLLHTSQSRQKSYADWKVHDVAFMVGERVLLRVSPMKGVMRFGKKGKLIPRYIEPFEILERNGDVAYKLSYLRFIRCSIFLCSGSITIGPEVEIKEHCFSEGSMEGSSG